jgi:hypothetical protein
MPGGRGNIKPSDNPKPFKKGDVPNPNGRPRKLPPLDTLLDDVLGGETPDESKAKAILDSLYKQAAKGNVRAAEILLDRAYGKPKQPVEHSGDQDKPIKVQTDKLSLDELKVLTKLREKKI